MIKINSKLAITPEMKIAIKTLLSNLAEFDIEVIIQRISKKRSLDANAYFHALCGQLAEAINVSKPFMKNRLLARYGQLEIENGHLVEFIVSDDVDVSEYEDTHLRATDCTRTLDNGRVYRVYMKVRGSRTYNTLEMSKLIEGTVSECKEVGISTETPEMLNKMLERWGIKHG